LKTISSRGIELVKRFESFQPTAYRDAIGKWTVGYGHTDQVQQGQRVDEAEALKMLAWDLEDAERVVAQWVTVPISQSQFDALVSFVFNVGPGQVEGLKGIPEGKDGFVWLKHRGSDGQPRHSTMLTKLLANDYEGAADEFPAWIKAGGRVLNGLVRRRLAEKELFEEIG